MIPCVFHPGFGPITLSLVQRIESNGSAGALEQDEGSGKVAEKAPSNQYGLP